MTITAPHNFLIFRPWVAGDEVGLSHVTSNGAGRDGFAFGPVCAAFGWVKRLIFPPTCRGARAVCHFSAGGVRPLVGQVLERSDAESLAARRMAGRFLSFGSSPEVRARQTTGGGGKPRRRPFP